MMYPEDQFVYCFECYKQRSLAADAKNWAEYIQQVKPNAVVWLQETRDVISGYCTKHQAQEEMYSRFKRPLIWHDVKDLSTRSLATFNGEPNNTR
jgi:hypothetical protein